jgi:hypothetical protein
MQVLVNVGKCFTQYLHPPSSFIQFSNKHTDNVKSRIHPEITFQYDPYLLTNRRLNKFNYILFENFLFFFKFFDGTGD